MEGFFDNFEVATFLNDDVFILRLPKDLSSVAPYSFDHIHVIKMVTRDFLVTALVFYGDIWSQYEYIAEIGRIAKAMHDARKLDPKAPYCPSIYLYIEREFALIPDATVRRLKVFCSHIQCTDGAYKATETGFEKLQDTSWDLTQL